MYSRKNDTTLRRIISTFAEDTLKIVAAGIGGGFVLLMVQLFPSMNGWWTKTTDITYSSLIAIVIFSIAVGSLLTYSVLKPSINRLKALSSIDYLTGLYNMQKLNDVITCEIDRSIRYKRPLSLILIDVDDFKRINSKYLHKQGNLILKEIGAIIEDNIRSTDFAFRYLLGDEFAILLPETNPFNARVIAERLRCQICDYGFHNQNSNETIALTVSIGVTGFKYENFINYEGSSEIMVNSFTEDAETLLRLAKITKNCVKLDEQFDAKREFRESVEHVDLSQNTSA
jgi:diguanylate cyclase (GGDEF)-like protein